MTHVSQMVEKDGSAPRARNAGNWVEDVLATGYHRYRVAQGWSPAVNLYEDESCYFVIVDLAGVDPEQIDLTVEAGTMALRGQRPTPIMPDPGGPVHTHLMEIDHGCFCRKVKLPDDIDVDAIKAHYGKDGYLRIRIPKGS